MSIAEKLQTIAENEQRVYDAGFAAGQNAGSGYDEGFEAGKQAEYDRYWDAYQQNGVVKSYQYSFAGNGWNDETFKPKYDIVLGSGYGGGSVFHQSHIKNIAEALEKQGVRLDTSRCNVFSSMFNTAKTVRVPELDFRNAYGYPTSAQYVFSQATNLVTIDKLIISRYVQFIQAFNACTSLENITIEGEICYDFDIHWSTKLSKASIVSIMNSALEGARYNPNDGFTVTFSLDAVNKAYETSEGANDGSTSQEWIDEVNLEYRYHYTVLS